MFHESTFAHSTPVLSPFLLDVFNFPPWHLSLSSNTKIMYQKGCHLCGLEELVSGFYVLLIFLRSIWEVQLLPCFVGIFLRAVWSEAGHQVPHVSRNTAILNTRYLLYDPQNINNILLSPLLLCLPFLPLVLVLLSFLLLLLSLGWLLLCSLSSFLQPLGVIFSLLLLLINKMVLLSFTAVVMYTPISHAYNK